MSPFYKFTRHLLRFSFATYFRWRVFTPDKIPAQGPAILASNHASFLDPPLVAAGVDREVHFLARSTLFRIPVLVWIIRALNAVPVDRDGGGGRGLKSVLERLKSDAAILLFPEGTRSRDGQLQPARSGIGLVVIKSSAPVIPVRIFGAFEAYGRGRWFPWPRRLMVKFGSPLHFQAQRQEAANCSKERLKKVYQEVADEILAAISNLKPDQN